MHWSNHESFQNEIMRVAFKNLNENILTWICQRPIFIKRWHLHLTIDQKKELLWQLLRSAETKHVILGMFLGQLGKEQLQEYLTHETSYKKRAMALIEKRILDQIEHLK